MSVKTITEPCGCQWQQQFIRGSTHVREVWVSYCVAHNAEMIAHREEIKRSDELVRMRSLAEEFT